MTDGTYQVRKNGRYYQVLNVDEVVVDSYTTKGLAKKMLEDEDIVEASDLNNLTFINLTLEDENEILNELVRLTSQEKYELVSEYERDNN